ncbi:Autotransporter-associated beta strand repeat protein [Posidoniimonas polymericola]|uniref:Autotransporter-associated beta strand repeat protein n=1 Tax=Posidoniimonas polymericola TaxID=2528002 RepID=A0A5C5YRG1_9BACT|nr:autotransporter-associated beta strand repeat-containing protein [Posidoniimonas polymericola]TWT77531.1 Autotransporter-associated beta strand repeat protein [Posidoniimonas polymericola]
MPRLCRVALSCVLLAAWGSISIAASYEWDGGAGDSLWNSVIISGGVQTNWSPEDVPTATDTLLLTAASLAGPVTISLDGAAQPLTSITANGVQGVYTFDTGVLQLGDATNSLLSNNAGGGLVVNSDIAFDNSSGSIQRFNVSTTGDPIVVNGGISTLQASGVTTLMLTSRNDAHAQSVVVSGVISDGAGRIGLRAGLDTDLANHTGVVRVTGANTFTGPVAVNAAILEFDSIANVGGAANALGQASLADSVITLGNNLSGGGARATLRYVGAGDTSDRVLRLTGGGNASGVVESSGSGPLVLTGGVTTDGSGQFFRLGGTNTDDNEFNGEIEAPSDGNVTSFIKEGAGRWILTGDSPGLDNAFQILAGELVVRGAVGGVGPNVFSIDNRAGATLTLDGGSITAGGIVNRGTLDFRSGTITLNGPNSEAGGTFSVGTDGAGVLRLNGSGHTFDAVTLDGVDDRIEFNAGTVSFDQLDNSVGAPLVSSATAVDVQINGGVFLDRVDAGTRQFNARIVGSGGYTKRGAGTIEFNHDAQHLYTGATRIEEGTLNLAGVSGLPISPTYIAAGATLIVANNVGGDATGGVTGEGTIVTGLNAGVAMEPASGVYDFAGSITGAGNFVKRQAGTQRLSGISTYTGATTVISAGGRLEVVSGGAITSTSAVNIEGQSRLVINGGDVTTVGVVDVATNGRLELFAGSLRANAIDSTGVLSWTGGHIDLATGVVLQAGGFAVNRPFQDELTLDAAKSFTTDESVTLSTGSLLTLTGGSLEADDLAFTSDGAFAFDAGTLTLRNDQTLSAARLQQLDVATPLTAAKSLVIEGVATIDTPLALAGGTLSAGQLVNPGNLILGSGLLEVTGGDLTLAPGETIDATSGVAIDVTAGGIVVDGELNAINATISAAGGITNNGDVNLINSTVNGDLVSGASGAATLLGSNAIGGDLGLNGASTLLLGIDSGVDFDLVTVAGQATLDGILSVSFGAGFSPVPGQQFEVLTAASIINDGLTLVGTAASQLDLIVGGSSVVLQATGGLPGDYNSDGAVDAADYTVWRDGLGTTFQQNGYDVWRNNYGASAAPAPSAVPAPHAAALLALASLAAAGARMR